jgi:osmotically-inducible protein OsmY
MKVASDTKLQHDVQAELEWEPSIDASKIGVTAKDGVVTLTGFVSSYVHKMTAERSPSASSGSKRWPTTSRSSCWEAASGATLTSQLQQ